MLDHQKFVLYHLEKTGGTFIIETLVNIGLKGKLIKGHEFYKPNKRTLNKAKIGTIRNPLAFYVSLWAYGCQKKGNFYHRHIKLFPEEKFLYQDPFNYHNFRKWLKRVLVYDTEKPLRIKPFDFTKASQYNIGLLTLEVIETYFQGNYKFLERSRIAFDIENDFDFIIKIEEWKNILPKIIKKLSLENEINNSRYQTILKKAILDYPNSSKHDSIEKYYDQETLELVKEKDKFVFQHFDY